jgi:hypothetical protein
MRTLFTIVFLGFCGIGFGQQPIDTLLSTTVSPAQKIQIDPIVLAKADSVSESKFIYCQIIAYQKLMSTKYNIILDSGNETKYFKDQRLRDEQTGMIQAFNSPVDALNFMGEKGWELVSAFQITDQAKTTFYYPMKKKVVK